MNRGAWHITPDQAVLEEALNRLRGIVDQEAHGIQGSLQEVSDPAQSERGTQPNMSADPAQSERGTQPNMSADPAQSERASKEKKEKVLSGRLYPQLTPELEESLRKEGKLR